MCKTNNTGYWCWTSGKPMDASREKTNKTVPKLEEGIHYTKLKFTVVEKNTLIKETPWVVNIIYRNTV